MEEARLRQYSYLSSACCSFYLSGVLTSLRPELRPSSSLYRVADELAGETFGLIWEWKPLLCIRIAGTE
ncbi:hypothetical protein PO124_17585 [Bacillus licheniformis]|nr:hypothetical protein [Bacillus licheniformis]